jgi:hypothetical protein
MAVERIQLRRGTEAQWTNTDPVLGAAEIGVELGTPNKFKIGDGSSLWSELDYFINSSAGAIDYIPLTQKAAANGVATLDANGAIPTGQLANLINSAPAALDTLSELAAALADDANFATTVTQSLSTKAESDHTHLKVDITDFTHTHIKTDITDFDHTHLKADITDFAVSYLELTDTPSDFTPSAHTHDASEITNTVSIVTTSTYTVQASDNGKLLVLDPTGGSTTITVDDVFSVGQRVDLYLRGTSASFVSGTGLIESIGTSMAIQYTVASLMCIASGVYVLAGSVE